MRIVVIGGSAETLVNFRGEMIRRMVDGGHSVLTMAPDVNLPALEALKGLGASYERVPIKRTGLNPFLDLRAMFSIARIFRRHRIELVVAYTAKAVIYGLLAARLARVGRVAAMITGVGSALGATSNVGRVLARVVALLYRIALWRADVVFFQNPDDEALFRRLGLTGSARRIVRINGSGVDLARFSPAPLPRYPPFVFLMVGRLLRDKGVVEYVEAARIVRKRYPEACFRLLGGLDVNPTAITKAQLDDWCEEGAIEYLGTASDVRPHLHAAHVCVLPSYGEGLPRAVIEAMAVGRCILTTDVPGCRETVVPKINGLLVPARDSAALANAAIRILASPDLLAAMGDSSRVMAAQRFEVHAVNRVIMEALDLA